MAVEAGEAARRGEVSARGMEGVSISGCPVCAYEGDVRRGVSNFEQAAAGWPVTSQVETGGISRSVDAAGRPVTKRPK
jgi:hypothetical protein